MLLHNSSLFRIYFGNAQDQLYPNDYLHYPAGVPLLSLEPYARLKKLLTIDNLLFLRQIHSATGLVVTPDASETVIPFVTQGDFLVTQKRHLGIGVMTADCLPLIFYDRFNRVIAVVHAGWRGSVNGVAGNAVKALQDTYGTDLEQLKIFFGPSAKVCCYKVGDEVIDHVQMSSWGHQTIQKHGDSYFFDLPLFNKLQLESIGVKKEAFRFEYNLCTIDDDIFFSYRRQADRAGRQMTVVCLK